MMAKAMVPEMVSEQEWLQPVEDALGAAVSGAYDAAGVPGHVVKDLLHGVGLGHPLHPVLTDVPVGAWTAALVMDAMEMGGNREIGPGADAAVAVGLAGAMGAAVTGLTDWSETDGKARRIGAMHGLLNGTAALLYTGSLLLRKKGNRGAGRGLSTLGYALVFASAYLGGHLVYEEQIGVDHTRDVRPPEAFVPVLSDADLAEGKMRKVEADGAPVLLARVDGEVHALIETCPHMGGPLSEGKREGDTVTCPWHGSCFSLRDGHVIHGPSAFPAPTMEARVRDGQIEVRCR
jgi:nitrite reductase/ring-hydroxylating ferredoxin subunit/uncharacterized membrane protein